MIRLIHEEVVARVATEEKKKVKMRKSVKIEHCFKDEGKHETTKKEENTKMTSLHLQGQKKKLLKGKIYIKQQILKDSFEIKRYGKGLLVQIKEEEMYKISIDGAFTKD